MPLKPDRLTARSGVLATAVGCGVFALLLAAFSPSWTSFYLWQHDPTQFWDLVAVRRGVNVLRQIDDPTAPILDPIHMVLRWRILFPSLGHALDLPPLLILALAPLGAVVVLVTLVSTARSRGLSWTNAFSGGVVLGAGSWFFTTTGWLGYFDSWLILGILAVAFAPSAWVVSAACLLVPWIDERIVIAFPLAMLVRRLDQHGAVFGPSFLNWTLRELAVPTGILVATIVLRLGLAGYGGSPAVAAYWESGAGGLGSGGLPLLRILFGVWAGLRVGWLGVAAALVVLARAGSRVEAGLLFFGVAATVLVGLATANDLSRSMIPVVPAAVLGWLLASRTDLWRRGWLPPALAVIALALPAHHVVSDFVLPVHSFPHELARLCEVARAVEGELERCPPEFDW